MRRKIVYIILGVVLILALAGGGYYYYTTKTAQEETAASAEAELQTAVARLGELTILASGTGQVTPTAEIGVGFNESGTLIECS